MWIQSIEYIFFNGNAVKVDKHGYAYLEYKDDRISYKPEILNPTQIKDEVDSGKYVVGFGLFPISIGQLKLVADNNLTMPPKSTYIEPKLRTGLTIFELNGT